MEITLTHYLIVMPLIFFAGFVDSIAGGGGLISLPAYMLTGMPMHFAYGTNKLSSSIGTITATAQFAHGGYIRFRAAVIAAAFAWIGSSLGSQLALILTERALQICIMIFLPAAAVVILLKRKSGGDEDNITASKLKEGLICAAIGFFIGGYDGFIGPGAGTFMIIAFTSCLGYSMITATGCAKVVNLASNVSALVTYTMGGTVLFSLGLPCALCSIAGNFLGSRMAMKKGSRFIRPVMTCVLIMLFAKLIYDFFL